MQNNYNWKYGESEYQRFYECEVNNDRIVIFANKFVGHNSNLFMINVIRDGGVFVIGDKTYNDRQRKKFKMLKDEIPPSTRPLQSEDVEYMKKKSIYCYEHSKVEISA